MRINTFLYSILLLLPACKSFTTFFFFSVCIFGSRYIIFWSCASHWRITKLFNTHLFPVLDLINPSRFIYLVSNLFKFFGWMQRWCWRCVIYPWPTGEEIWEWNSHVADNHKVNMSIIHSSYDLIYQRLNYSFSWFLSLSTWQSESDSLSTFIFISIGLPLNDLWMADLAMHYM